MKNNELMLQIKTQVDDVAKKVDKLTDKLNNTGNSIDRVKNKAKGLSSAFNFGSVYLACKKIGTTFLSLTEATNDYSENLNLFNVVLKNTKEELSKVGKEGIRFQNTMNEAFGTNMSNTLYYQGLYQSMAENMGIISDKAYIMSENTTKLVNDLSSLYNKSESTTAEALRAGIYAGQTKPLRAFGVDVTENTLQRYLDKLNIKNSDGTNKTVRQLGQAEKQILRYLSVLEQTKIAHKDWANTIESPSNQLKIFNNLLTECKVALGSLFQGAFAKMLPYANAILMVIKEVTNAIATMLGIELTDYNNSIGDMSGAYEDLEESIDNATDSVKKLKKETLSFDNIHNINENTDNGTTATGGISKELLDAIYGYDNGMYNVNMKAKQIRDNIMDWLGFTKEVNEETGDIVFKLDDGYTNLEKIRDISILIGGTWLFSKGIKLLTSFIGTSKKIYSFIEKIGVVFSKVKGSSTLATSIEKIVTASGGASGIIALSVAIAGWVLIIYDAWKHSENFRESINELKETFIEYCNVIKEKVYPFFKKIKDVLLELYEQAIQPLLKILWAILEPIIQLFNQFERFQLTTSIDGLTTMLQILIDLLNGDFESALNRLKEWPSKLSKNWDEFKTNISNVFSHSKKVIEENVDKIGNYLSEKKDKIIDWFLNAPYNFGLLVGNIIKKINSLITETDWVKLGKNILNGIIEGLCNFANSINTWRDNLASKISNAIKNTNWSKIGENILAGIISGMNKVQQIKDSLSGFGSKFIQGIKDSLGIHSPSKLVIDAKIGDYVFAGIEKGMETEIPNIYKTANNMVDGLKNIMSNASYDLSLETAKLPNYSNNIDTLSEFSNINKTTIDYSAIQQASYYGFAQAIREYGLVQVNVEARTEEGTIVETAIKGINKEIARTGELPFTVV